MDHSKRVQADLQAAEALEAQLQAPTSGAPVVTSVADLVAPPAANPPPNEPTQQQAPVEPVAQPAPPKEDFEHKYRVLQGMYSADVASTKKQLSEMERRFAGVVDELTTLKARETSAAPAPAVDSKDVENFGADLVEMVQRHMDKVLALVNTRLGTLEQKVNGVTQQTALTQEQQFYATLGTLVPDWKEINVDQRWLAWLAQEDPVYGAPRQAALDVAHQRMDPVRVASVFKAFKDGLPPPPAPSSLADQVAPSGAASVVPVATPPKPFLSEKAINDFYRDLGRGFYAGREAEANQIEAEINAAVAEGRVR